MTDAVHVELARPDDPGLDEFESGNAEVDAYFKGLDWLKPNGKISPPVYVYRSKPNEETVGYAAAAFGKVAHPDDGSSTKKRYLTIFVVGVDLRFQGERPRDSSQNYASAVFDHLEQLATEKDDCVGLSLRVRTDNPRAIAFYKKQGFQADPNGPVQRDRKGGAPHLSMRKLLRSAP